MSLCVFGTFDLVILGNLLRLIITLSFGKKRKREEKNMEGRRSRGRGRGRGAKQAQEPREEKETVVE